MYHIINEYDQVINKSHNNKNKLNDDSLKKNEKPNNKRLYHNSFEIEIYVAYYVKKNIILDK